MSVFYYEPFYDFDRLLDDALSPRYTSTNQNQLQRRQQTEGEAGAVRPLKPRMDLHEDPQKNEVTATFELPGLRKEDVNIEVQNGRLIVSGESKMSTERDESGYAVRERRYGKFSRTLQLPAGVKESDIKANLDNGVLTVTFPKTSPEMAPKKINIS
ncbi:putative small heat shock protein (HSP20) family protein [Lyophyllum shimeji]|uniref:Small heat shock protein (HSP20) family protein n=1 Tax=Lyophyllum shimeji TaxID=47721 RepID=A0A9P3PGA6_LYOSH|nr:putative small heat shock protein (HSP20) family protein [Lyophyllum shimeji]